MKKIELTPKKKRTGISGKQSIASLFLLLFLLCSCEAKAQNAPARDLVKVFSEAGVSLLRQSVPVRDFSLPLASSGASQQLSGLKGKVVFLNFWATWCGPCRAEMPSMESLYKRLKNKGLEILAVNCAETEQQVAAFMRDNKLSFPAALDSDGQVSASYGIQAIPTTFLVNREGKIIARVMGSINWDTPKIHAALEKLLDEPVSKPD